jgi:hypothetical protein
MIYARTKTNGDAIRAHIKRTGKAGRFPVWTPEETAIVVELYPDYNKMIRALPQRTRGALGSRARALRLSKREFHRWTREEVTTLRRLVRARKTWPEILAALPSIKRIQIKSKLRALKLQTVRKPPRVIGIPVIDAIRSRAFALNLPLEGMDDDIGSHGYFHHLRFRDRRRPNLLLNRLYVLKAIRYLDGELLNEAEALGRGPAQIKWSEI